MIRLLIFVAVLAGVSPEAAEADESPRCAKSAPAPLPAFIREPKPIIVKESRDSWISGQVGVRVLAVRK